MKNFLVFVVVLITATSLNAQNITDTIHTPNGLAVLFSNHKWQYIANLNFDGCLNKKVEDYFTDKPNKYSWPWNNNICYPSQTPNDLLSLQDTLVLNLVDSLHPNFVIPYDGEVTSRYGFRWGRYHKGIDIAIPAGDTVVAAFDGKVRYSKYNNGGFGYLVIIRQYNGLETFYAHLSKLLVSPNEWVKAGQPIGLGGSSGHAFGSNLHFEVRFYDHSINPEEIINFKDNTLVRQEIDLFGNLFRLGAPPSYTPEFKTYSEKKFYKIRKGDTLSRIAQRNSTSIRRLCKLNDIRKTKTLRIGKRIRIR